MKEIRNLIAFSVLQLFAEAPAIDYTINATSSDELSPTMKEYYDTQLLANAREEHYFAQFGKTQKLPKGRGKTIEWRKWKTIDPALTPLTEGVTPSGQKLGQKCIKADISQYGDWAPYTDQLDLHAVDDTILGATEEFSAAGAQTQDLVIRNAIHGSEDINVYYAGEAESRSAIKSDAYMTGKLVNKIATILKKNKAPKINGDYVAIIHPSVAMDLRNDEGWLDAHKYAKPEEIFNGEIGKLHGVRFVETNNAKVYGANGDTFEGTSTNASVYCTYFFGKDAWGVVDPEGAGMEMIIKPITSGGADNPLNQRGSIGYKFSSAAKMLYPERLICAETTSSFGADDKSN